MQTPVGRKRENAPRQVEFRTLPMVESRKIQVLTRKKMLFYKKGVTFSTFVENC